MREKLSNLKPKKLINNGYIYFDYLKDKIYLSNKSDEILVAPSWNKNRLNFINEDFEEIITNLLNKGFKVRFRPHPETLKRAKALMKLYKEKFESSNFIFDDNSENLESLNKAKFLITDNSGISIEYMMIFKKPVIFYNDFDKIHNEEFKKYNNLEPLEDVIKKKFGYEFNKHEIRNISHIIEMASEKFDKYEIDNFLEKNFSKICN